MPIRPENRKRYPKPKDWKTLVALVRDVRAKGRSEWCGAAEPGKAGCSKKGPPSMSRRHRHRPAPTLFRWVWHDPAADKPDPDPPASPARTTRGKGKETADDRN